MGDVCDADIDGDGEPNITDCDSLDNAVGAATTWYIDNDGDGLGDNATSQVACAQPAGYVADNTDANDDDFDNDGVITANDCDDTDNGVGAASLTYYVGTDSSPKPSPSLSSKYLRVISSSISPSQSLSRLSQISGAPG